MASRQANRRTSERSAVPSTSNAEREGGRRSQQDCGGRQAEHERGAREGARDEGEMSNRIKGIKSI